MLVAYAAKHGQVALDGESGNSPFVTALVSGSTRPGSTSRYFRLVRDDVLAATGRQQEPFMYGSLPGEISPFGRSECDARRWQHRTGECSQR